MDNNYYSAVIHKYAKSSQHICICSTVSILLIFLFMISPLNKWVMTSLFGKVVILFILGYTLYYNIQLTNKISNDTNVYLMNGSNSPIKLNITCSWIFSLFLLILGLSVIHSFFK